MLELVCYKSAEFGDSTIVIAQCPHYELHWGKRVLLGYSYLIKHLYLTGVWLS